MTVTASQLSSAPPWQPAGYGADAQWVVFSLDNSRYALPLIAVVRIVRAVAVTPLPLAPPLVLGAIEVAAEVLPVFDLRYRFRLPRRSLQATDQFLIARTSNRTVVLIIDVALDVIVCPSAAMVDVHTIAPGLESIRGVMRLPDGLVLIHDLEQLLSTEEARLLDHALSQGPANGR